MDETVEFEDVTVSRTSEKALWCVIPDLDDEAICVPRSVITDDSGISSDAEDGAEGTLVVKKWWAEKNGHI